MENKDKRIIELEHTIEEQVIGLNSLCNEVLKLEETNKYLRQEIENIKFRYQEMCHWADRLIARLYKL